MNLRDPLESCLVVADALERAGHPHALYGGLLLAAYGEPRETRDVDLAVVDLTTTQLRAALAKRGIDSAPGFEPVRFGGLLIGRVTLLGAAGDSGLNTVDLVRPVSPRYRSETLARARRAPLRGSEVFVLTAEDFVLFKLLSTRDLDLKDAASVLRRTGALLDLSFIEQEVARLAVEIPHFDVTSRLRQLLA